MSNAELKKDAISFGSNLVIGVASTAPAYSLAAALPALVAAAKFGMPSVIVLAFLPMLFIAVAYYHLNRADPDCGTTFSWATRAFGPYGGWLGGWAIIVTDILVMPGLSQIAGEYSLHLVGVEEPTSAAVTAVGVAWIILMTLICYIGIELSANSQKLLLGAEIVILLIFAAVALTKVYSGGVPGARIAWSWFNPFSIDSGEDFMQAMLIAIFIYWGWDTGAAVNEETKDPTGAPARAAVISTLLLVCIYVIVGCAAISFAEPELEKYTGDDFLAPLANHVLGPGMDKLLLIAVLTSAASCTQTTILPAVRTALSMARAGSLPKEFAEIHPRYLTPGYATLAMGVVSIVWYLTLVIFSNSSVLADSVTATAIGIAFYYGLTGFACVAYFRHEIFKSTKNFIFIGLIPGVGGLSMLALFIGSCINFASPDQSKTSLAGVGTALIFGAGGMLIGVALMLWMRVVLPTFFARRPEVVDPVVAARS